MEKNIEVLNATSGETPKNEQLFKTKKVEGTPFQVLNRDGQHFLIIGNNLLTPGFDQEDKLWEYVEINHWNITGSLILLLIDRQTKQSEYTKLDNKVKA